MLGTSLQFGRGGHGEDRVYNPARVRRNLHSNRRGNPQRPRNGTNNNDGSSPPPAPVSKGTFAILDNLAPENRLVGSVESSKPAAVPASTIPAAAAEAVSTAPSSNLDRFLDSMTPSVLAQYLPKTTMRGWGTCDVQYRPYFVLGDLWESFTEWSAYGAGVPLVLNDSDCVVQYYVPYLSGIQLYEEPKRQPVNSRTELSCDRRSGEESDSECYRDSSSDGSSDCEFERGLKYSRDWNLYHLTSASMLRMDRLSLREKHVALHEGSSSDDGEADNSQGHLLFEFLERDTPYSREPLADKISDLACHFPELRTLRSCDLLPSSWISVAWYPIYRIPIGPTLRDLDACFLSFHSLSTPIRKSQSGDSSALGPIITYPPEVDGVPKISLPVFGLASYKFKGSMWTPSGGSEKQLANSLQKAVDDWLQLLHVDHPDYQFFASHGTRRR